LRTLLVSPGRYRKKPGIIGRAFHVPPLSLGVLASLTPPDVDVKLIDENLRDIDYSDVPDLVGITCLTAVAPRVYEIARNFRERGAKVVLGGMHPSAMPLEAQQHADSVVVGEAEGVWSRLIEDFKSSSLQRFYKGEPPEPGQIATPSRRIFDGQGYFVKGTVQTSRGCPYGCDFCSVQRFFGNKFRFRSVPSVVDEIRALAVKFIAFVDDNIAGSRAYAKELFTALTPLKVKWICQAPINIGKDPELLRLMYRSGCRGVFIGFESIAPESLKEVGKTVNVAGKYKEYIEKIHDAGISVEGAFIFGFDNDDRDVFKKTLDFMVDARIDFGQFAILTPFPGTSLAARLKKEDRITTYDWNKYDITHAVYRPAKMTAGELEEGRMWIEQEFYSMTRTVKRMFTLGRRARYLIPMFILNTSYRSHIRAYAAAYSQ
jgi:radical SAM superfamily enzyme YgiQ (UPF0313 family)